MEAHHEQTTTRDAMSPKPVWIGADESVARAAEVFAASGVGVLPVCSRDRRPLGVLTDRDLVLRVLAQGADPAKTRVRDLADADPVVADAGEPCRDAARRLAEHRLRRLPVVEDGRLVGVVSRTDIAKRVDESEIDGLFADAERPDVDDGRTARWIFGRPYAPVREERGSRRRRVADEVTLDRAIRELARRP